MAKRPEPLPNASHLSAAIAEISVRGFKSISEEQRIEVQPLTILAGANSSGKSSMMQPLLLLKQTLEKESSDPGALLLHGPNVRFTSANQLLSRIGKRHSSDGFHIGIRLKTRDASQIKTGESFRISFRKGDVQAFGIEQMEVTERSKTFNLWPGMTSDEIIKTGITQDLGPLQQGLAEDNEGRWEITPARCVLELTWVGGAVGQRFLIAKQFAAPLQAVIPGVIHLPGLRGNPERTYPVAAIGLNFTGTFEDYTASVLWQWMAEHDDKLNAVNADLKLLNLAGGVTAAPMNDVQIELFVSRLPDVPPDRLEDRVNIADVGVGVSQTLPVLVALHAAKPDQLVYIEQPETHLHPRAQFALAHVLASAANRGVRVVAETHSSMLLLGVQTLVAEGKLAADRVKLHWFERDKNGRTAVRSGELDEAGRFGDWPEDFDDVTLKMEARYLDAAEARLAHK